MSKLDDLFAREARSMRRHEIKMKKLAICEADPESYFIAKSIKTGAVVLCTLIISIASGCTITSVHNTPIELEQFTHCEEVFAQVNTSNLDIDCGDGTIEKADGDG